MAAALRPRAAGEGSSGISRCSAAALGWKLCRCCDTHRRPGARQYMAETRSDLRGVPVEFQLLPGTKALCYTLGWRYETASLCCTEDLGDGEEHRIDLLLLSAPPARRAMGLLQVKPEGAAGERTAYTKGGHSCSPGRRHNQRLAPSKQKKSCHGCDGRGNGNTTQGLPTWMMGRAPAPGGDGVVAMASSFSFN
ncbi:hypothetical protein T440DRAFT_14378 [Plenodomus tracheiphilus IPT5]|uniref:Uncharacterized protein n=1 Tax=Plenodomus tracheiphilus IPT5 TaxID=1408161 RepID=A0A6A7BQD3_9PLEO|nr:hypothetical protein T440DRAFT_14378 [Plenodomus tracheiphilus IPT5]